MNSTFTLLFMMTVTLKIANGSYQVEVRVLNYSNPTGRCQGCPQDLSNNVSIVRSCCDAGSMFTGPCDDFRGCDSYFIYCLRPLNSTAEGGCTKFENQTSTANMEDGPIDFSQSTVLGLANPLLLQGLTDAYTNPGSDPAYPGVQLYIEIMDEDSLTREGSDDLVDILLIDHTAPVGDLVDSLMQGYSGIYGFAMMDLSISVSCVENFQGSDCTQCVPGLTGTDCLQVDDCFGLGVNCSGNGHCVDGVDSFNCSCDPGFTGELCQTNIDECVRVDCSGNGWCVNDIGNFTCNCSAGYTGTECEVNIDDCVGVDCSGNGECLDGVNSFTCECNPGYTGQVCDNAIAKVISGSPAVDPGIIGSVLGVISLVVILIVILAVLVILALVIRQRRKKEGADGQGTNPNLNPNLVHEEKDNGFQTLPGDNPVYALQEGRGKSIEPTAVMTPSLYAEVGSEADIERVCDNPIYGSEDTDDQAVYTTPGLGNKVHEPTADHEFENIIYGTEAETNMYSLISDPAITRHALYDTVTKEGQ